MGDKNVLIGGGVVIVLLVLAAAFFGTGDSGDEMKKMIAGDLAPVNESVAALDARVGELQSAFEGQIADIQSSVESQVADLQGKLDGLSSQAAEAVSKADLEAVQSQITDLTDQTASLSVLAEETAATLTVAAAAPAVTEEEAPAAAEAAAETETATTQADDATSETAQASDDTAGASVGQTVILADGMLRAFVSRVSDDSARLSVGGKMMTLGEGQWRTVRAGEEMCKLTLTGLSGSSASADAVCGKDRGDPAGLTAGKTAALSDGALRVFVSRVTAASARLSIDGALMSLEPGESAEVKLGRKSCTVALDDVDRGHALVSGGC